METSHNKFINSGEIEGLDLRDAVLLAEMLMASTSPTEMDSCYMVIVLKTVIASANLEGSLRRLGEVINWFEAVVVGIPPRANNRVAALLGLSTILGMMYDGFGGVEEIEQAIKRTGEELATIPSAETNRARAGLWKTLGSIVFRRYESSGAMEDFEQAIKHVEAALAATPSKHEDRLMLLCSLSNNFFNRYTRYGEVGDLEQAIEHAEEALAATPSKHKYRPMLLNNLSNNLLDRYMRSGVVGDLEQAIERAEEALATEPAKHTYRAAWLTNLGIKLLEKYMRFGVVEDLGQAIKHAEEALSATPPEHTDRVTILNNLSNYLSVRYRRFGAVEDLEKAIEHSEAAVAAIPSKHTDRAGWLTNLSNLLSDRYVRFRTVEDLEQAIRHSEAAVAAITPKHRHRAPILATLGIQLEGRYAIFGRVRDLKQAIRNVEEALAATPPRDVRRGMLLGVLGGMLNKRYSVFGAVEDLEQAIERGEEALSIVPPEHITRGLGLLLLASRLISRHELTHSLQDFYHVIHTLFLARRCQTSPPDVRILAAFVLSLMFACKRMWQDSSSAIVDVVKLLPLLSPRSIGRINQEYQLSSKTLTQITPFSVSFALQAGEDASYCLRLFELGRGVIMGLVIDCRSDLSELCEKHPAMFEKFHSLRVEIDSISARINLNALPGIHEPTYEQIRDRRQLVADQLEETLISIRELPGFEGFQLPPHAHRLMSMASDGPIVIFNSTEFRSDAIIVTSSSIKELRLQKLIFEEVKEWMGEMRNLTSGPRSTYGDRNSRMLKMLQWLWDVAVEPVCKALQLDPVADDTDLPRVWWIGAGPLATAPFHAAGNPKSKNNTMSRAISSYIPTIKALSYARQKNLGLLGKKDSRILLVTMPTTPGKQWSPLPGVVKEAKNIADLAEGKAHTTQLECPSAAQVLAELPSHDAIHFACHGKSDPKSPSNSALQLQLENESGEPDRLTVEAISNMKIQRAQIAYLSACCTAENASEDLADESIYIASGFQLAGFSHVLATQWVSIDKACLQVSGEFYRLLFDGQPCGSKGGHRKVSSSFHSAVKKLRDANWRQPVMWASFIHTGV